MLPAHLTFFRSGFFSRNPEARLHSGFASANLETRLTAAWQIALGLKAGPRLARVCSLLLVMVMAGAECRAQQTRLPSGKGQYADLSSDGPQKRQGDLFIADENVDLEYAGMRLRADHMEYNDNTRDSLAQGHVVFDYQNEHLEADEAHYNLATGIGKFTNVRGTVKILRRPNPLVLVSENPLYFEAKHAERYPDDIYVVHQAWITVCDQQRPTWQMFAPRAKIRLNKSVALVN